MWLLPDLQLNVKSLVYNFWNKSLLNSTVTISTDIDFVFPYSHGGYRMEFKGFRSSQRVRFIRQGHYSIG